MSSRGLTYGANQVTFSGGLGWGPFARPWCWRVRMAAGQIDVRHARGASRGESMFGVLNRSASRVSTIGMPLPSRRPEAAHIEQESRAADAAAERNQRRHVAARVDYRLRVKQLSRLRHNGCGGFTVRQTFPRILDRLSQKARLYG
jgi:hypothetical protein